MMQQVAIFVDAGYLFAAGSTLLTGSKQPRELVILQQDKAVAALVDAAALAAPDVRLLRIYWYDGVRPYQSPSAQQTTIGLAANVKLRLGIINSSGEQKGVDALIVTDLIDLARNGAISDALIITGDEDVRVGVQVAQTFGVRVHLLGIEPSRGNQSPHLLQEVDSQSELNKDQVGEFMEIAENRAPVTAKPPLEQPKAGRELETAIASVWPRFADQQLVDMRRYVEETSTLPREIDAPLLAEARTLLGRDLDSAEKRNLRSLARARLSEK